ncbi:MAG: hypothetical protein ABIE46_00580 [Patescibacteria group bacterium]
MNELKKTSMHDFYVEENKIEEKEIMKNKKIIKSANTFLFLLELIVLFILSLLFLSFIISIFKSIASQNYEELFVNLFWFTLLLIGFHGDWTWGE